MENSVHEAYAEQYSNSLDMYYNCTYFSVSFKSSIYFQKYTQSFEAKNFL